MFTATEARKRVNERGPRYAVTVTIRRGEERTEYADTAERAEQLADDFRGLGYYQVQVHPPVGAVDLAPLGKARDEAQRALAEATSVLRAGCLRALEAGRSEVEVARSAGIDRMTLRKWQGK